MESRLLAGVGDADLRRLRELLGGLAGGTD
jgi:hypothetical protein